MRDQVHFLGNYSLAIIAMSGLFVGFVLGLQGITRCSATDLRKRWAFCGAVAGARAGPGGHGFVVRGRAGTSLTAEIGLMRAGEQLSAMEMMAVDPVRRILAPGFGPVSSPCPCWLPCSAPWA